MKPKPTFFVALISALITAVTLLAGCARTGDGEQTGGKQLRLAFVTNNAADFWTIARRGTEKADAELPNVEVEFKIPSDGTAAEQKRLVDDLVSKGIEGMAISPVDPANQTGMINDVARQALVITQDSDAPDSERTLYIGTDNRAAGRKAGELIKEVLPQGGKIMVFVGKLDAQNAQERLQGIRDAIANTNIQIVDARTDDTDIARAKSNAADALVKYPEVACMVGLWAYNGPAILNAVRESGKIGQVKIVCFDEDDQTLQGVRDGSIYATVVQQPYEFGYQSIKMMAQILGGDRSPIPAGKQLFIDTPVIKRDSVEDFITKTNALRGRG